MCPDFVEPYLAFAHHPRRFFAMLWGASWRHEADKIRATGRSLRSWTALAFMVPFLVACGSSRGPVRALAQRARAQPLPYRAVIHPPAASTTLPAFEQGAVPQVRITATGRLHGITSDSDAFERARLVVIQVAGPESTELHRLLVVPEDGRGASNTITKYYQAPFGTQVVTLGRYARVGRYQVAAKSPAGLDLAVEPTGFEIVPGPAVPVAALAREDLAYDRYSGSGPVVAVANRRVVANDAGDALYIDGPDTKRLYKLDGRIPSIATSGQAVAVAYATSEGEPRVSLFDGELRQETSIGLGAKHSVGASWRQDSLRVSWNPRRSEWLALWLSGEQLTKAEVAKLAERGEMIPMGVTVARFARISPTGKVHASVKLSRAEVLSNLVWNGKEHAVVVARRAYSPALAKTYWRMTLVQIRHGRVVRRTSFDHSPRCGRLYEMTLHLAWDGKSYVAAIKDHGGLAASLDPDEAPTTRVWMFRLAKKKPSPVEMIVDPNREIGSVTLQFFDGQLWLVYARTEKHLKRAQAIAAALRPDLRPEKVIVLDDGYDSIREIRLFEQTGILKAAIFRDQKSSVVALPSAAELERLIGIPAEDLHQEAACVPGNTSLLRIRRSATGSRSSMLASS